MNLSALNSVTLNGGVNDPIVRTRVESSCFALANSTPRVLAYVEVNPEPWVLVSGGVGRYQARPKVFSSPRAMAMVLYVVGKAKVGSIPASAQAKVTASPRVVARSAIWSTPEANPQVNVWKTRAVLSMEARATVSDAVGRVLRRTTAFGSAQAQAGVVQRVLVRYPLTPTAHAVAAVNPTVFQRRYVRSPVQCSPVADTGAGHSVEARLRSTATAKAHIAATATLLKGVTVPVLAAARAYAQTTVTVLKVIRWPLAVMAQATVGPGHRVQLRELVHADAFAAVTVRVSVDRQLPWDEEAPMDRRFKVNPGFFAFKVVS